MKIKLFILYVLGSILLSAQDQDSWWQNDGSLKIENVTDEFTFRSPIVKSASKISEGEMILIDPETYLGTENINVTNGIFSKDLGSDSKTELRVFRRKKLDENAKNNYPYGFDLKDNNYLIYGCKNIPNLLLPFRNQEIPWDAYGFYAHGYDFRKTSIKSTDYKQLWNRPKGATWWDTLWDATVGVIFLVAVAAAVIVTLGTIAPAFITEIIVAGGITAATLTKAGIVLIFSSATLVSIHARYGHLRSNIDVGDYEYLLPQEQISTLMELPIPNKFKNADVDSKKKWNKRIDKLSKLSFNCTDFPNKKCYNFKFKEVVVEMIIRNAHVKYVNFPGQYQKDMTPYQLFKNSLYVTDKQGTVKVSTLFQHSVKSANDFFDVNSQILPRNIFYAATETTAQISLENYDGLSYYYVVSKDLPKPNKLFYIDLGPYGTRNNQNYNLYRFHINSDHPDDISFTTGPEGPFLAGDNIRAVSSSDLIISAYRSNDLTPVIKAGYSIKETNTLAAINFKAGDSVVFESKHKDFLLEGLPEIWLARAAGESKYYCTPSIKPNEYRPFLGYDSQVHAVALRKHPNPDKKKTPNITFDQNTGFYKWYWIAQRRMSDKIIDKTKRSDGNVTFNKYKTAQNLGQKEFPIGGGIKVQKQRNNQREGFNMQLLYAWQKNTNVLPTYDNYDGPKYILGTDPDEIIYIGSNGAKIPSDVTGLPDALLRADVEKWKRLPEGENSDPICEMVTAYQKNREFVDAGDASKVPFYDGYEILDKGNYRTISIDGVSDSKPCNGLPCVKYFQNGLGLPDDNNKEMGHLKFEITGQPYVSIPVNLSTPQSLDNGFYGSIEGDQWPSEWQKNVPYSFTGLSGLSTEELNTLVMEYTHENELGILTKETRYFRDTGAVDANGKWTVHFDLKGWGYNEITVYAQRRKYATMVPIAGMELLEVAVRFVSAPGSKWKDFSPTKLEGIDLKEGRGGGHFWYLRDANEDASDNPYYGKPIDDINKTYTISAGDRIVFTTMDKDPHTFFHYDVEWYLSERFMAKRLLPDDLKYRIHWFLAPVDDEGLGKFVHKGRWFDKTFDKPGKYRLTAVYGLNFDKNKDTYNHSRMSHEITVLSNNYSTDDSANKGVIEVHPISSDQISWLQAKNPDAGIDASWRVAEIDNIFSKWTHVDGPRAEPPNDNPNRYGLENDYNAHYKWFIKTIDSQGYPATIPATLYFTEDKNLSWFPFNWTRHNSGKTLPNDMDISLVPGGITSTPAEIDKSLVRFYPNNLTEPWQWRLPWISLTNWQGYRTRSNIKSVFNMKELFDNQHGAFAGVGVEDLPDEDYIRAVSNPLPELTDNLKSNYDFYLDLLSGRKIVYNPQITSPGDFIVSQADDINNTSSSKVANSVVGDTSSNFYMGADMSSVKNLEDEGITWTESGVKKDPYDILSSAGANIVRFRLWVSPKRSDNTDYNYSTLSSVTAEIKRAKAKNLKILLDLHYSDNWTDPGKNVVPSDWSTSTTTSALENSIKKYTKNVLQHLKENDALPDIVQTGNEINNNILLSKPYDQLTLEETASEIGVQASQMNGDKFTINWDRNAPLLNAALKTVRDFSSEIKTMLHLSGPTFTVRWTDLAFNSNAANRLGTKTVNLEYVDIIGISHYKPEASKETIQTLKLIFESLWTSHEKDILLVETAFPHTYGWSDKTTNVYGESTIGPWPKIVNSAKQLEWLITLRENLKATRHSMGFLYWEPFWVGSNTAKTKDFIGSNWENLTFFEFANGVPTEANELAADGGIKVFSATASTVIQSSAYSKIILVADTETPEISEVDQLKYTVYPNPTADELTITFHEGTYDYLELLDSKGRVLYEYSFNGKLQHIISTKDLQISTGFILLRLSSKDGNTDVKKVIVK